MARKRIKRIKRRGKLVFSTSRNIKSKLGYSQESKLHSSAKRIEEVMDKQSEFENA